ncbi:HPr family phosphocarrier protein [Desulfonema magnum]|uniref:Phosphocarrier protein HPr n=1 Tax=Desulfonema magnum TaxID=45655 RepID=A0A975BQJ6_9BACT|nr:HPr family phosphocarrier protein [Desulfonema magnum]QTA89364.1 Phosphocarrier protein [Desulfonema magnum]
MDRSFKEFSKDVVIVNELGLHARSAARIAEIAGSAKSEVRIRKGEEEVDAKSIIDMLTLGCAKNSTITIKIGDYDSDINILNRIVELVESGFGE